MKLSDYFDKIFIIGALNSPKVEHTIETLKKLGLYDENVLVHMYTPMRDIKVQVDMPNDVNWREPDRISLTFAHYTIVKQAYDAGLNSVLVLEDDNIFLNNIDSWEKILTNIPDDWDVVKFGGFMLYVNGNTYDSEIPLYEHLMRNGVFRKIDDKVDDISNWAYSASAIAFNRNGMKVLTENQEKNFRMSDYAYGIFSFSEEFPMVINIYMPTIPLFVPIDDLEKYGCGFYMNFNKEDYI